MIYKSKIAVFDLDGTLWAVNSHVDIVEKYYNLSLGYKIYFKVYARIQEKKFLNYINLKYQNIPLDFINAYNPDFRETAVELLNKVKTVGYFPIIVSNAPEQIIKNAAKRLQLSYLVSPIGCKYEILTKSFKFETLIVCTDNITDTDLLSHAREKYIYVTLGTKKYFYKHFAEANFMEK